MEERIKMKGSFKMKVLKKVFSLLMVLVLAIGLFSCGNGAKGSMQETEIIDEVNLEKNIKGKKIAVVYFTVDDQVQTVAEEFATEFDADIFEIIPDVPYKSTDVDFDNPNSRVSIEDEISIFPENETEEETYETSYGAIAIVSTVSEPKKVIPADLPKIKKINVDSANIIILGFPSWNNNAPKPVYTFLKDLKNKIIVPFCTDGEFGRIDEYMNNFVDSSCTVMTGKEFSEDTTIEDLREWMAMLSAEFNR